MNKCVDVFSYKKKNGKIGVANMTKIKKQLNFSQVWLKKTFFKLNKKKPFKN